MANKYLMLFTCIGVIGLSACSSGGTSSSSAGNSTSEELGVAAFIPGASVAESNLWVSTAPSTNNWSSYISGTTSSIVAMAANSAATLVFDGTSLLLSNNNNNQFTHLNFTGNSANFASITAGSNEFVMYTNTQMWNVTNNGVVTAANFPLATAKISSVAYLNNTYFAYTNESTVYSSINGLNWELASAAQNIQPFTQVLQLGTDLYIGKIAPDLENGNIPNLWLGTSPTNFNPESQFLLNFFNVPAQVNFIATDGNNNLYINETVFATNATVRLYKIYSVTQLNTGPIVETFAVPGGNSGFIKPSNVFITPDTIYIPTATTTTESGNVINPFGPSALTATPNTQSPSVTTTLLGSQTQTNGQIYTIQNSGLLVAPVSSGIYAGNNGGNLTFIANASNPSQPVYKVLPSGESATYATLIGNTASFMLLFNNGGAMINTGSGFIPVTAISDTTHTTSVAINNILSAGSLNGTFLVQATSLNTAGNGNLYFSNNNGQSWTTISESDLINAHLGTLIESGVSINQINKVYNITTNNDGIVTTYQTTTPTNLATWVLAPTPTPLLSINGTSYALYADSNQVGALNNGQYTIITDALPQNYFKSGNIAYNNNQTIALAQGGTVVEAVDKIAGSNYLWTASTANNSWLASNNWLLNQVSFYANGVQLINENFNQFTPVLLWNGKMWFTYGNAEVLQNATDAPGNVYSTESNLNIWNAIESSSSPIIGTPILF